MHASPTLVARNINLFINPLSQIVRRRYGAIHIIFLYPQHSDGRTALLVGRSLSDALRASRNSKLDPGSLREIQRAIAASSTEGES